MVLLTTYIKERMCIIYINVYDTQQSMVHINATEIHTCMIKTIKPIYKDKGTRR